MKEQGSGIEANKSSLLLSSQVFSTMSSGVNVHSSAGGCQRVVSLVSVFAPVKKESPGNGTLDGMRKAILKSTSSSIWNFLVT